MALSGSVKTSDYDGRYYTLKWTATQSAVTNTSTISWEITCAGGQAAWYAERTLQATINGVTVYNKTNRVERYAGSVKNGTITIEHNAEGEKSFSASLRVAVYVESVNCTGSKTFTLDTIVRASQPSLVTWPETTNNIGDFGTTFSIFMNRAEGSGFTHTVRYEYGTRSGIIDTDVTNDTSWAVPLEFMNDIPESNSASGRIYVDTYNGSTLIGTKYTGFTVTVPASVKPSLSVTLEDTTGIDDIYGSPVKGLSKIKITPKVTTAYGSPIASYAITANGVTYSTSTATTSFLATAGSSKVTVTVTDKRGRFATWSYTMTVLDYVAPVISSVIVRRCDEDGTENDQGEYAHITFSAAISSMSSKNTATYKAQYKKSTDTAWTEVAFSALNNKYTVTNQTNVFAADGNYSYDIEVIATDRHGAATRSTSVSTAFTLYNCHPSGTGWRFGGVAEKENTLQNDLDLVQVGNSYATPSSSHGGTKGYICLAQITVKGTNVDSPIVFTLIKRRALCQMTVYLRFTNNSSSTDPTLYAISYEGDNYNVFAAKIATSVWGLYVDNIVSTWDRPSLQSWYTRDGQRSKLDITFPDSFVEGTNPSVLGDYYRATPAAFQSIRDYVYPVGSIYLSYSHVSPATLFGGTWVRIENAFLWATGASGTIGQTGGESEHVLTVGEMPSHTHAPTMVASPDANYDYTFQIMTDLSSSPTLRAKVASGSDYWVNAANASASNDNVHAVAATAATGGGVAHNNMPPYIQVSAWRRTA